MENDNEIKNIYIQIEKLKLSINKKEDDLKNIINEKDIIIQNLLEKILAQETRIENNEKEIEKLKNEIETNERKMTKLNGKIENNEKEMSKLNDKIENNEREIKKINMKNEELVNKTQKLIKEDDIKRANKEKKLSIKNEIISKGISNILRRFTGTSKNRIEEELKQLMELEKNYGFLNSIGVKLLKKKDNDSQFQIEGLVKAPENSPYKNGIFNFVLKYPQEYPERGPELKFITKILHCECSDNGHCCVMPLNQWKSEYKLSQILGFMYHFFICSYPDHGYGNEATQILRQYSSSFFEEKCREYVRKFSDLFFDDKSNIYLFQGIYDEEIKEINSNSNAINCVFVENGRNCILNLYANDPIYAIRGQIMERVGIDLNDKAFIVGNKVYSFNKSNNELVELLFPLNNKTMFIIPKALPY